jgi:hypothetical protein
VPTYPRRLPHVLTRSDLARVLLDTYVDATSVDDEEGLERLGRALSRPELLDALYGAIGAALAEVQGPRTSEDDQLDRLGKAVEKRRARVKAVPAHPAVSAVLVRINLELGLAPEQMRATLETEKGRAVLADGLARLGRHVVKELLK